MLSRLQLRRFRNHGRLDLAFDGRPVAIHGPNGAGKTNILEAISLLAPGRGLRRAHGAEIAQHDTGGRWQVAAVVGGHEVETWSDGTGRQVRIDDKAATQLALGSLARVLWLVPAMDRLWIEAPEGRRRFLDRLVVNLYPGHAAASVEYERALRERNRLLRDGVADPAWYGAIEARMAAAGARVTAGRVDTVARLQAAQEDGAFPAAALGLDDGGGGDDLAAVLADGRQQDLAAGRTRHGPHRADLRGRWARRDMPADQCSTGEQKALLISLVLANARLVRQEAGMAPIILLDEVAAHLDPDRRAALYDLLIELEVQAFLTGTEAGLFAGLAGRAAHLQVGGDGQVSVADSSGGLLHS